MNTLALGYVIPTIRAYSGLVPVRQCSCRAYRNRKARTSRSHIQSPYYHRMQKTGHNIRQNCGQRKPCAWFGRLCSGQAMLELLTSPKISADSVMNFSSKRSSVKNSARWVQNIKFTWMFCRTAVYFNKKIHIVTHLKSKKMRGSDHLILITCGKIWAKATHI